jgi:hypothetical protein
MTVAIIVIALVVVVAAVVVVALLVPDRVASGGHGQHATEAANDVDAETEAYRGHPPGGGTGSL